ncbi:MAG: MFS transporter [Armatimonadota bacterium]
MYYGWVILAASTLGVMMTTPGQTVGVSAFLDAIIRDLGMSRSSVSLMYSVGTLAGSFAMPWVGRWIDHKGPRLAVTVIAVLFALACVGMSRVEGPIGLALGFLAIRSLGQGALGLVSLHVLNLWFVRRRGLAVGLKGVGMAAASACFPIAIHALIAAHGWRTAYAVLGLLIAATILPVGALLFRERPELYGLYPDGHQDGDDADRVVLEEEWTLADARRTALFWLLVVGSLLPAALSTGLVFHHFSIMQRNGVDQAAAATVFVPMAAVAATTNLVSGILLDRIQPRLLLSVGQGLLAAALLMATQVRSAEAAWLYGALLGMMQGMQGAISGTAWAHYFGRTNHGAIKGFAFTVMVGGSAFGPLPFAWGLELFGSYAPVLGLAALLPLSAAAWALFVRPPSRKSSTVPGAEHR